MTESFFSIRELARDDRPREKLFDKGPSALSNAEILSILIGSGTREKSAVRLCQEILNSVNNDLGKLGAVSIQDLMKFKGIGQAKAVAIAAALELGRRRLIPGPELQSIRSSSDAYQCVRSKFEDLNHEEFYLLILNRAHRLKNIELISKGGISGTVADGKLIFKKALELAASGIILCHNHPSGNLKPSEQDIQLTRQLKSFGAMIDLPVLDHLIVTSSGYYSFADEGMM